MGLPIQASEYAGPPDGPARMAAPVTKPAPISAEGKVKILVVDDLPEKHVVFRTLLEDLGLDFVSATSGKEALARVLEQEFAVILLDVNMPDIDGLETSSLIRQYRKSAQTPFVFFLVFVVVVLV